MSLTAGGAWPAARTAGRPISFRSATRAAATSAPNCRPSCASAAVGGLLGAAVWPANAEPAGTSAGLRALHANAERRQFEAKHSKRCNEDAPSRADSGAQERLREAEAELEAATGREVNAAAKKLQRVKTELRRLEAELTERLKGRATCGSAAAGASSCPRSNFKPERHP
jgi:hypothetical protein